MLSVGLTPADLAAQLRGRTTTGTPQPTDVLQKARQFTLSNQLRRADLLPWYTEFTRNDGATCLVDGRRLVMLGSNDYLGLTADPRVREAVANAALVDGPSMTGSRLLNGSTPGHAALERRLAQFLGREDALLFTTGYQANIGLLSAVLGRGTVLLVDNQCHASIYDGAAVAGCTVLRFRHNDPADLDRWLDADLARRPAMVMVDGVYSMSGDLAVLADLKAVCDRYGVPLAVDDAHGLGMVGATGRGIEEELGLPGCAEVLTGTFSKSLASVGGWVTGDRYLIEWIRYHSRSMLFSAAIPPTALAAAAKCLEILIAEPWRLAVLNERADYWRAGLSSLGLDIGQSTTAVVPVIVGDELTCLRFCRALLDGGVYANCILAPAVPSTKALIRTSITTSHEQKHLDQALETFEAVGKRLGLAS